MKDGRTHLAHKVEHAVDFSSGAVVAVTLQPADTVDATTGRQTVCEAGEQIATLAGEEQSAGVNPEGPKEVVLDKGYHSNEVLAELADWKVRSYGSEPDREVALEGEAGRTSGGVRQPVADSGRTGGRGCCGSGARSWNGALRTCMKRAGCDGCICGTTRIFSSVCWCTWQRSTWDWSCASFWVVGRLRACRAMMRLSF